MSESDDRVLVIQRVVPGPRPTSEPKSSCRTGVDREGPAIQVRKIVLTTLFFKLNEG